MQINFNLYLIIIIIMVIMVMVIIIMVIIIIYQTKLEPSEIILMQIIPLNLINLIIFMVMEVLIWSISYTCLGNQLLSVIILEI